MTHQYEHNLPKSAFIELPTVDSTNNYALNLLRNPSLTERQGPALHGTIVFAHEQYQGKGQRNKEWMAQAGKNLHISLIFAPEKLKLNQQFILSAATALAVRDFFRRKAKETICIKWPNDIYFQDRKAGGILIENVINGSQWHWAVLGIGLNINQDIFNPLLPNPVSLQQITGKNFDCLSLAKELSVEVFEKISNLSIHNSGAIMDQYNLHLYKKGQKAKFRKDNRLFEALVHGVSPAGRLKLLHGFEEEFDFGQLDWVIA